MSNSTGQRPVFRRMLCNLRPEGAGAIRHWLTPLQGYVWVVTLLHRALPCAIAKRALPLSCVRRRLQPTSLLKASLLACSKAGALPLLRRRLEPTPNNRMIRTEKSVRTFISITPCKRSAARGVKRHTPILYPALRYACTGLSKYYAFRRTPNE
jgi:hypothetical protein